MKNKKILFNIMFSFLTCSAIHSNEDEASSSSGAVASYTGLHSSFSPQTNVAPSNNFPLIGCLKRNNGNVLEFPENSTSIQQAHNRIVTMLPEIHCFRNLGELNLSHNTISVLPEGLGELINLRTLQLKNNQIRDLPSTVFRKLLKLQLLNLDNNQLRAIPAAIVSSPILGKLRFMGNSGLTSARVAPEVWAAADRPTQPEDSNAPREYLRMTPSNAEELNFRQDLKEDLKELGKKALRFALDSLK
jgi:Leucine-rich repeat (LRR) protein